MTGYPDSAKARPLLARCSWVRVLITHDFFETFGGAERVTAEIAAAFPEAPVHAILGRRSVAARMGIEGRVSTILPEHPALLRHYRLLAPVYPAIVRSARLPEADVVIASNYAYAHGFRTSNDAPVICYCHGPLRHVWSQPQAYAASLPGGLASRIAYSFYVRGARLADRAAAGRVTRFLTQSPFTADLIREAYGRAAELLPPPIDCELFRPSTREPEDYFLFVGRLVEAYKRPSIALEAFRRMPERRLLIAGDGPAMQSLRRRASPNVEFLGALRDHELVEVMQRCQAAIFPSIDDFGLVPLEVNACGRPVLALRAGGPLHTLRPGVSGNFIERQTAEAVEEAVASFDPDCYDPARIRSHALQWDRTVFRRRMRAAVERTLGDAAISEVLACAS